MTKTRIYWDTESDPRNPCWVARQLTEDYGYVTWPLIGYDLDADDNDLVDAADPWAPAGFSVDADDVVIER